MLSSGYFGGSGNRDEWIERKELWEGFFASARELQKFLTANPSIKTRKDKNGGLFVHCSTFLAARQKHEQELIQKKLGGCPVKHPHLWPFIQERDSRKPKPSDKQIAAEYRQKYGAADTMVSEVNAVKIRRTRDNNRRKQRKSEQNHS